MTHHDQTCADWMTTDVFSVSPELATTRAAGLLIRERRSGCPVVEDGRVVGVISEIDLIRALYTECHSGTDAGTVSDHMTPTPVCLGPMDSLDRAACFFFEYLVRRAPVVDGTGALVGVVSRRDVLQGYEAACRERRVAKV